MKIPTIKFSPISEVKPKNIAILVAGIHGDEFYATTTVHEVIKALIGSYATPDIGLHNDILKAMEVWVVAIANSDRHLIIEELAKHTVKTAATSSDSRMKSANFVCKNQLSFGRKNVYVTARKFKTPSGTTIDFFRFSPTSVDLSNFLDSVTLDVINQHPDYFKRVVLGTTAQSLKGIDINRNFPSGFAASTDEYLDEYSGQAASSELETYAVQAVIDEAKFEAEGVRKGKVRILIDIHQEKLGFYRHISKFRDDDPTGKDILAELQKPHVMSEGDLKLLSNDLDNPKKGSCEDYARDKGVEYPLTLEITNAGAGTGGKPSFPAKDSAGEAIPVGTIANEAKEVILRILELAAKKS